MAMRGSPLRCGTYRAMLACGTVQLANVASTPGPIYETYQTPALEPPQMTVDGAENEAGTADHVDSCSGCFGEGSEDDSCMAAQPFTVRHGIVRLDGEAGLQRVICAGRRV
ncbi:hypothetical protein GCM10023107_42510 [Actinoplanes octamycinicus]|nr:hypothetical protein Aoc01nite_55640 [Actinoplanes octamycinicus]